MVFHIVFVYGRPNFKSWIMLFTNLIALIPFVKE